MSNLIEYKLNKIENLKIRGRNVKNAGKNDGPVTLFWAGSGIEVNAKTSEVWATIESDFDSNEVWLCVFINGRKISRFMASKGVSEVCLCRNLNPEKENRIFLMRDTQPMSGDMGQILKVHSLKVSDGTEFFAVPDGKIKIEFVGDSITSGEGLAGCPDEWDWISQWISVSENYAVKTAMAFDADFNIESQCGWGVVTGWDNNVHSNMPDYYEYVCGLQNGECQKNAGSRELWDFSSFKPDIIFVNLGTNDSSSFSQAPWKDPADGKEYKMRNGDDGKPLEEDALKVSSGIKNFLKKIRKYNPKARICWIWGMLDLGDFGTYIQKGVDMFISETGDKNTETFVLTSMECEVLPEDKGSRGHPGPKTHREAAAKLGDYIRRNLQNC